MPKPVTKFSATTTLFDILRAGGTIKFPSGYELEGDTSTGYIQLRTPAADGGTHSEREEGICNLSEKGVAEAIGYAEHFERERTQVD